MSTLDVYLNSLKAALFGKQNQRIEYMMDRYFQMPNEYRLWLIGGGIFSSILLFFLFILAYLSGLNQLQVQLDDAYRRANQLKDIGISYIVTQQQFVEWEKRLVEVNRNSTITGVLEQKTKELNITTATFPSQVPTNDFPSNNPLSKLYQNAKLEIKLSNLSLKKILELAVAIESSPHMYKVSGLSIRGLYQNRVYFDSSMEIEGIVVKR